MKAVKRSDGYWVTDFPIEGCEDIGPYTKEEAQEHIKCLEKTFKHWNDRKFWTTER
jgi:HEPN domain-containing protein